MRIACLLICILAFMSCRERGSLPVILYVNSYHQGYPPSDAIMMGIDETLSADSFNVVKMFMDTKRKSDSLSIHRQTQSVLTMIDSIKPDVIIVSDDAAVHYVIQPNQDKLNIPVVYCGVNWSSKAYGLRNDRVTGMLEVLPLPQLLDELKMRYPGITRMAVLSENSLSENQNKLILDTLYRNAGLVPSYYLVDSFDEWKRAFAVATKENDFLYLPTNGSIKNWSNEEAEQWIAKYIAKPVVTCDDFMMPFCVFGLTKVPEEQGIYVAQTAKWILRGRKVETIREISNVRFETWFNPDLAEKIGFEPPVEFRSVSN
jgi:ABC-type uncharacterized transport system substrate-binding protein